MKLKAETPEGNTATLITASDNRLMWWVRDEGGTFPFHANLLEAIHYALSSGWVIRGESCE